MNFPTLITAAAAVAIFSSNAFADGRSVTARDLDLSDRADAAVLYSRIQDVARSICDDEMSPWDGQKIKTRNLCIAAAVEDAVEKINKPQLTAVHRDEAERVASL